MRIAFFSDAHGNQLAVRELFESPLIAGCDAVVFGGDVFGYYYGAEEVLDMLRGHGATCLMGNHDRMFLDLLDGKVEEGDLVERYGNSYSNVAAGISDRNVEFVRGFLPSLVCEADGLSLYFAHGSVADPLNGRVYPDTPPAGIGDTSGLDYVFLGHTHHKMLRELPGVTVVNPGSIGQQRDGRGCSYVVFDSSDGRTEFYGVEYDVDELIGEIERREERDSMRDRLIEVLLRRAPSIGVLKEPPQPHRAGGASLA